MDKFNVGIMPRTKTGLVPTVVRQRLDLLSTTKHWSTLPAQPAPPLYKFRGDYINARNRRKLEAKKLERETRNPSSSSPNNTEFSSIIALPPRSPRHSPTQGNVGWNSNYKYNSFKLTQNEQHKQVENKIKFTEFLRIEAAKRQSRSTVKNCDASNEKSKPQDEVVPKKTRKPPVPRLSVLARARAQGKVNARNKANVTSANLQSQTITNSREKGGRKTYLDFITRNPEKILETSSKEPAAGNVDMLTELNSNSNSRNAIVDDESSMFKLQLERIVRRANLIIEKRQHAKPSKDITTGTHPQPLKTLKTDSVGRQDAIDSLDKLEMCAVRFFESSCAMSGDTSQSSNKSVSSRSDSVDEFSQSAVTEVIPRVPVPMQDLPRGWTNLYDHFQDDSSPNLFASETEMSTNTNDFFSDTASQEEQILWQGNDSLVKSCKEEGSCPEASVVQLSVKPSISPKRREFEDEPLPRGHGSFDFEVSNSPEDDFFSLFE